MHFCVFDYVRSIFVQHASIVLQCTPDVIFPSVTLCWINPSWVLLQQNHANTIMSHVLYESQKRYQCYYLGGLYNVEKDVIQRYVILRFISTLFAISPLCVTILSVFITTKLQNQAWKHSAPTLIFRILPCKFINKCVIFLTKFTYTCTIFSYHCIIQLTLTNNSE